MEGLRMAPVTTITEHEISNTATHLSLIERDIPDVFRSVAAGECESAEVCAAGIDIEARECALERGELSTHPYQ
jgi:hypothetical protein